MLAPIAATGLLVEWYWPVPIFASLAAWTISRRAIRKMPGTWWSLLSLGIVASGIAASVWWRPRTWQFQQEEQIWSAVVAGSAARIGVGDSAYFAGHPIFYHWFGYAWSGSVARLSGIDEVLAVAVVAPIAVAVIAMLFGAEILGASSHDRRVTLGALLVLAAISTAPIVSRGFTFFVADSSKGPAILMLLFVVTVGMRTEGRWSWAMKLALACAVFSSIGSNALIGATTLVAAAALIIGDGESMRSLWSKVVGLGGLAVAGLSARSLFFGLPGEKTTGNAGIFGRGVADYLRSAAPETAIFEGRNWAIVVLISLSGLLLLPVMAVFAGRVHGHVRLRDQFVLSCLCGAGAVGISFGHTDRFAEQVVFWTGASAVALPVLVAATVGGASRPGRTDLLRAAVPCVLVATLGVAVHVTRGSGSNGAVKLRALYPGVPLIVVGLAVATAAVCGMQRRRPSGLLSNVALALVCVGVSYSVVDVTRNIVTTISAVDERSRSWTLTAGERMLVDALASAAGESDTAVTNAPTSERVTLVAAAAGVPFHAIKPPAVSLPAFNSPQYISWLARQRLAVDDSLVSCGLGGRFVVWLLADGDADGVERCGEILYRDSWYVLLDLQPRGVGGSVD
ncbi:MAG: hypothetical protein ACKOD2_18165 [Ilumatobacteraceae bacterium]